MAAVITKAKALVRGWLDDARLPVDAKNEMRRDARGLPDMGPSREQVVAGGMAWLALAQDRSASQDGGVARDYSLVRGWNVSYPETTGYIVPTMLDHARDTGNAEFRERARRMCDWLVSVQHCDGGFLGGTIGAEPAVQTTFNTGQILMGLAAGQAEFGTYNDAMTRAADWLVATQDADGCWRRFPSPFTKSGEKTYETHVSWGLLEAARVSGKSAYADAALRNMAWAIGWQRPNGWFERCCLIDPERPLTHTLGYVLRGLVEGYLFVKTQDLLTAARKTADGLLVPLTADGRLPGRLDADWRAAVPWVCLTGTSQIAHCWLLLYRITGETKYREAAHRANSYVRRTIRTDGAPEVMGAVKGSFPCDGLYGRFEFLNWACKFTVDANKLEAEIG